MQHILKLIGKLLLVVFILYSCDPVVHDWKPDTEELVISEIVETGDEYSEFYGLLESTGISGLLAVRGPFTLFLPNNDAMNAYYTEKGISSYLDLSAEKQTELAMYHIIDAEIDAGGIGLGALIEVNGIGDYLVSEFEGSDIIINKHSKIIDQDIIAANGVIHEIAKVIDPVTKSVYDVVAENPAYSIFAAGLDITGIRDTLDIVSFPFGKRIARTRYTILAIADTTFHRYGINSVNDLIAKYTDDPDNVTDMENGFYRYMEYHCLSETWYFSDLKIGTFNYPVLSYDNYVSITVDNDDYKVSNDVVTKKYTPFIIEQSNIPGKNGTIHTIVGLLPVLQPKPATVRWAVTNHFDMKQLDNYGKTYDRFFDGQNDFENIKWEGSYLLYYYKNQAGIEDYDLLSMQGWWWCEVTTPKIMKGKYRLTGNIWSGWVDYAVFVNGVETARIAKSDAANSTTWAELEFTETKAHKIKVVATSPGILFWDYITFTPINY